MENNFMNFEPAQILAAIGVGLLILEIFTTTFFLLPLGVAFLATALVALFTSNWIILLTVLAVFEIVMFILTKKLIKPYFIGQKSATNADAMIGKEGVVTEAIPVGGFGDVKLYGDNWRASMSLGKSAEVGERVIITALDGNKVVVKKP